ncbi:MAG: sulfatase-like hydrolase/transferase, partial [Rubripirellula sp.]|nr:sulfatase-like hydrolase/transferase [Rubripirellula sp.]
RYRTQRKDVPQPKSDQYRTDYEADRAIDFINQDSNDPFFLMVSPFAVHIPLGAMSDKVKKYRERAASMKRELPNPIYAAMVEHCDDMLGRLVEAVDQRGLTRDTMILFTSDNGGLNRRYDYREAADDIVSDLAPLKGEKGSLHEGGVRVPLIIKYPAFVPAGSVCKEPTISYDFYPTFVELAGGELPQNQTIDGHSLVSLLMKPDSSLQRDALHWHYPHFHHDRPASSIREREWKLIEYLDGSGNVELYNLREDLGESQNLASEFKGRAADLKKKLQAWRQSVGARMPYPNPHHDSDRAGEWWSMRTGMPIDSDSRKRFPPTELD